MLKKEVMRGHKLILTHLSLKLHMPISHPNCTDSCLCLIVVIFLRYSSDRDCTSVSSGIRNVTKVVTLLGHEVRVIRLQYLPGLYIYK